MGLSMVVVGIRYCYGKFLLGEHRFEGATGDRNEMAMAMVMAWPLLFMLGLTTKVMWKRAVAWASLVPLMLSIVFCLSRGGMLGLIAVVGYVLYRLHHKRWLWVVGICGGLVGLANLPTTVTARFMSIGSAAKKDASAIGRLNAWGAARAMVRDRPFWGVGSGNFLVYFRRYAPDPNDVHVAHSSFYQLMGEQGLPGLIVWLYLVLMTWTVGELVRDAHHSHREGQVVRDALHARGPQGLVDRLRLLRRLPLARGHGLLLPPRGHHLAVHGLRAREGARVHRAAARPHRGRARDASPDPTVPRRPSAATGAGAGADPGLER